MDEFSNVLLDTVREYNQANKVKDKIIILLIVLMFLEAVTGYAGFIWYESQFETVESVSVDLDSEGDNANAIYNDVDGNQYNDNATHNEGVGE